MDTQEMTHGPVRLQWAAGQMMRRADGLGALAELHSEEHATNQAALARAAELGLEPSAFPTVQDARSGKEIFNTPQVVRLLAEVAAAR